jgi:hypothetical protein
MIEYKFKVDCAVRRKCNSHGRTETKLVATKVLTESGAQVM